MAALDESLWQLGRTAWASLEGCLGAEPLRLLAEVSGGGAGGGARGGEVCRRAPHGPTRPFLFAEPAGCAVAHRLGRLIGPGRAERRSGGSAGRLRPAR